MAKYEVVIKKSVFKTLSKLNDKLAEDLENLMLSLENNPRPSGYKKLKGRPAYRIRQGNYRIIYEINDNIITVTVTNVGHRKDVYDK
jgi:mRNA interferase RelE/StbE